MKKIFLIIIAFFIAPQISFADTLAQSFTTAINGGDTINYARSTVDGMSASTTDQFLNFMGGQSWIATSTYHLSSVSVGLFSYSSQPIDGYLRLNLYEAPTTNGSGQMTSFGTVLATSTSLLASSIPISNSYPVTMTNFVIPYGFNVIVGHTYFWGITHVLGSNTANAYLQFGWQYSYYGTTGTGGTNVWHAYANELPYTGGGELYFQTYMSSSAPDSLTLTAPYPQTYIQNPITFIGSYHAESLCYKEITVEVQSITQAQTLNITPFSFNSCPANPDQTFSFDRTLPYVGQYRARVKLTAFDNTQSLPWSPWHEFDLGQISQGAPFTPQGWTPETCDALDLPCHIRNAFGVTFYPSVTSQETLSSTLSADNLKYRFPIGYITDFVTIVSTSTESSLVVVDATLPSVLPGGGAHIHIDLAHILDPVLNATSTIFNNESAPSTQTFYEITSHYWNIVLYLAVVFYIIARIVGSHIVPDLGHMNTDTQDMRSKSFSSAEAERYRYKEWLYKNKKP